MRYHNHRAEPYFTFLKTGQKTIEGRVREGWYCNVKPGDEIEVYNNGETESILTKVKRVTQYQSVREMLTSPTRGPLIVLLGATSASPAARLELKNSGGGTVTDTDLDWEVAIKFLHVFLVKFPIKNIQVLFDVFRVQGFGNGDNPVFLDQPF